MQPMTQPQPEPQRVPRQTPTLLVFTLGADAESRKHRLLPERWRGAEMRFRRSCLDRVMTAGRRTGFRVEVSSPGSPEALGVAPGTAVDHRPQRGASFGGRLHRALGECLKQHGGPVVVVGTDVPGLAARHLEQALTRLGDDPDRVVVGPSPDGGFYLLATHRPIDGLGSAVRWCCGKTLDTLLEALTDAGRPVVLLEPLTDLDRPADLERWLAGCDGAPDEDLCAVVEPLLRILAILRRPRVHGGGSILRPTLALTTPGRGPPLLPAVS
jgi:glycosyltransferase A (GT-A) superfamily protein (DUF2064 family)